MSNPADILSACAAKLSAAFGTNWSVSSFYRSKPEPPQIDMMLGPVAYDLAMGGGNQDVRVIVRATVQAGEDSSAQQALYPLMDWSGSGTSLKAALEADRSWGGTISSCRVTDVSELKLYPSEAGVLPGLEFTVEVTPNG